MKFLSEQAFSEVIQNTPLVSIDLLVKNRLGQVLLGQRRNRPAQNLWFVPGGRILKDESIATAFQRLSAAELGHIFEIHQARLLGPFDHFYTDNVYGNDFSTHYVVLAYELMTNLEIRSLPVGIQHEKYQWFDIDSLLTDACVHEYTKNYLRQSDSV
jgi:colanic acid biosynthesis protein WcaH